MAPNADAAGGREFKGHIEAGLAVATGLSLERSALVDAWIEMIASSRGAKIYFEFPKIDIGVTELLLVLALGASLVYYEARLTQERILI